MSAMHWEARRKQVVIDRKFEVQQRLKELTLRDNKSDYYDEAKIREIAEQISRDVATPIPSMLNRSHAQLVQRHGSSARKHKPTATFEERLFVHKKPEERVYSAKLRNRYNSISYTQQY